VAPPPIGGDPKSDPADSKSSSGVSDRISEGLRKGSGGGGESGVLPSVGMLGGDP